MRRGGDKGMGLKKGPWTKGEDEILVEYVRRHGEGNWNALQKNSGLSRCGKSCRLRWANHLRPNLKKGSFSHDEEHLILRLHAQLGNKWARMAASLPGRTDNEIKNYWNTRIKKRLKAGLPLYPPDVQPLDSPPAATPPSTPSTDSSGATRYPMPGLVDFPAPPQLSAPPLFAHHPFLRSQPMPHLGLGYQLPPFSCPPISRSPRSDASALFRYGLCNNYELGSPVGHPLPELHSPVSVKMELPLNQSFSEPFCAGGAGQGGNSGLLDALLQEAQNVKLPTEQHIGQCDTIIWSNGPVLDSVCRWEEPTDSIGIKPKKEPMDDIDPVHEDISTLLDMIPTVPMSLNSLVPEWYNSGDSGEVSNGQSSEGLIANDGVGAEMAQSVKPEDHDWTIGSCPWNNLPGIC